MMKRLLVELLWIAATAVLAVLIMLPIYQNAQDFQFFWYNVGFIFVFITFTRYIFILQYTFLYKNKWVKGVLFFLCIPTFFFLTDGLFNFQSYIDDNGAGVFYEHLPFSKQKSLARYTRSEYILFGVGSMITIIILPIRLIISTWRDFNSKN